LRKQKTIPIKFNVSKIPIANDFDVIASVKNSGTQTPQPPPTPRRNKRQEKQTRLTTPSPQGGGVF
jgi:hypothetical protein